MSIFLTTYNFLYKIIKKEDSFTMILNRNLTSSKISSTDVQLVRDTLKSTVNKYYFLKFEINSVLKEMSLLVSENELNVLVLGLSMVHYVKNINIHDVLSFINQDYEELGINLSLEEIENILNKIGSRPLPIPEKVNQILSRKLAVVYSYPEWIIKMMFKHFGVKDTYKSVASSRHSLPIVITSNPMKMRPDDLDGDLFVKTSLAYSAYQYAGKEKIIQTPLFKENKIFVEDESTQLLVEILNPSQGDDLLFVGESSAVMALDACLRCNDFCNIKVACKDSIALQSLRNIIHKFQVESIRGFETEPNLLISHVEPRKMDKVVVIPTSSSLGLVRRHPDILLSLNRTDLDKIIENEKNTLEESECFVKPNGYLLYAVFTMNVKEGQNIIKEFLDNHNDYVLEQEKQLFPYVGPSDGMYYARLKKIG